MSENALIEPIVRSGGAGYQTMVQIAYRYMWDAIVSGELRSGDRVQLNAIAFDLGVSRVPLREALRMLEERGFVEIKPHRGVYIVRISKEEMRSLYSVRILVESASAAEAALNMDDTRLATLRSILSQGRQAYADDDADLLSDLNRRFHLVGHSANGNEVLLRVITDLSMRSERYRLLHSALKDRSAQSLREHERLLEAWEAHDSEAARQRVTENLKNSEAALLQSLDWRSIENKERDEQDER